MNNLKAAGLAGIIAAWAALPAVAETFSLTVVAGHPPIGNGVSGIRDFFIPEVNKRLAENGKYTINWTQAYAGSVADVKGVLEAVESGIADMGYVPHLFEGDKLPLEQITYVTPFGTKDLTKLMEIIEKLHTEIPEMEQAWARANQKVLAPVGVDTYYLLTNFPVDSLADIKDHKIGVGGLALNWLKGTGAVPVSGALTTYYNAMSTGLYEGVIVFESAIAPYKFHEVAPYITDIGLGATYASALTVNLDTWNSLPEDLRDILQKVALEYRDDTANAYARRGAASLAKAKAEGATFTELPAEMRADFAKSLPNLAKEWAARLDAQGQPGTKTLEAFLRISKEAGAEFSRDWSAE